MSSQVRALGESLAEALNAQDGPADGEEWVESDWEAKFLWGPEKPLTKISILEVLVIGGDRFFAENTLDRCGAGFNQDIHVTVVEKVGKPFVSGEVADTDKLDCLVHLTEQIGEWLATGAGAVETANNVEMVNLENATVPFDPELISKQGLFLSEWVVTFNA